MNVLSRIVPENRRDSLWHFMSNFLPEALESSSTRLPVTMDSLETMAFSRVCIGVPPFMFSTKEQGSVKDSDSLSLHKTLGVLLFVSSLEIRQLQNELHQRLKKPTRLGGQGAMKFLFHVSTLPFPFF